jgi:nucleoside-diphosphate-sugar epimerase
VKILITGANGFIGQYLTHYLVEKGEIKDDDIIRAVRQLSSSENKNFTAIGNIDQDTNWQYALQGVDIVIHLAARVHVMNETSANPLQEFRKTNRYGTINLAQSAIKAGAKRFIYLSSIKVNGEKTTNKAFFADNCASIAKKSTKEANDPYAISKQEAEQALLDLQKQQQLEVVIIRPPLVYGPGVKGNFARLIKLVKKQLPLPLAGIKNKRSLVSIDNLCSLISCCIEHPKASGEVFLVSDGDDVSTSQLMNTMAQAMDCKNRLFKLPYPFLKFLASLLGKGPEFQRLFESLTVDISKNKNLLSWKPELSLKQALEKYLEKKLQMDI